MNVYKIDAIESRESTSKSIQRAFANDRYSIRLFNTGRAFLNRFQDDPPDLVIVDLDLVDVSGLNVLKEIRSSKGDKRDTRVLAIGQGSSVKQRCEVYNIGADGFMDIPFDMDELSAMVHAQMRRVAKRKEVIHFGPFTLDKMEREAKKHGAVLNLTNCEFLIFQCLMESQGKIVAREALYACFGDPHKAYDPKSKALDMHIKSLRGKLGDNDSHIRNVYGGGYKIME